MRWHTIICNLSICLKGKPENVAWDSDFTWQKKKYPEEVLPEDKIITRQQLKEAIDAGHPHLVMDLREEIEVRLEPPIKNAINVPGMAQYIFNLSLSLSLSLDKPVPFLSHRAHWHTLAKHLTSLYHTFSLSLSLSLCVCVCVVVGACVRACSL